MDFVYFGDGFWATQCLERILKNHHRALAVILRQKPSDYSLKEFAERRGIEVRIPQDANDASFVKWILALNPQLNVSMSYDQILQRPILESAPLGFINCHAGKLPFYRGRNVINWVIMNNEKEIGLTIHYMDEDIDTGDVILQKTLPIHWEDTYNTLLKKIQETFPDLLVKAMELIEKKKVKRKPQKKLTGTYFCRRVPGEEWIDWDDTSLNIYNKVRAITHPGPGARTLLGNKVLILWKVHYDSAWPKYIATPGEVVGVLKGKGVTVKTGDSTLLIEKIQFEEGNNPEQPPAFPLGTRFGLNLYQTVLQLQREVGGLKKSVGKGEK